MRHRTMHDTRQWARVVITVVTGLLLLAGLPLLAGPARAAGPCDPPVKAIVCENSKPGSPQGDWMVTGYYGDIMGYGTAASVQAGETLPFKIKTPSTKYHVEVYRLGWYGGDGARKITTLQPTVALPQSQPNCLVDAPTGMTDCGNWAVSTSWSVPSDAVSGYYVANFIRDDATGVSQFPFVVRDDSSRSAVLVQASDQTWQAYNSYGGNNLYTGTFSGSSDGRAFAVSYNRPYENSGTANFMNAELPMLRWLERNGYDVSYISSLDTSRNPALLLQHRTFMSSGHDEYWTAEQRTGVENARAAGVNLAFFSGNEMFWKTRFAPSVAAGAEAYRTLVCYKETKAQAKIDPSAQWTGTWRDPVVSPPSDGGRPENALTGTLFRVNGYVNDAITVGSQYSALRFWRNTAVAALQPGQSITFANGTLGYEWDEDADNGSRPAGSLQLSRTTVTHSTGELVLQDQGNIYGTGTVDHSLVLYRDPTSNALVFGAGTVQWSWGLDDLHLFPGPAADSRMQQATVNLLADMGAQPATLQSGLVAATASTDTTKPTTTITAPAADTTVPAEATQTITGTSRDTGGVVAAVEVSVDGGTTYRRATPTGTNGSYATWSYSWTPSAQGPATVTARASDDSANLGQAASSAVTIGAQVCPCTLFGNQAPTSADSGDTGTVELGTRFVSSVAGQVTGVRFYKSTANTGTHTGSLWTTAGQLLATGTFTGETASGWQTLTFATPVSITAGTTYVASYQTTTGHYSADSGYYTGKGAGSAPLTAPASSSTAPNGVYRYGGGFPSDSYKDANYWVDVVLAANPAGADTTPPTVTATTPGSGATGAAVGSAITASFSEPVSGTGLVFGVTGPAGAVAGSSTVSADGTTATFTPASALPASTTLTASARAQDLAGNPMASATTWSFTTGTAPPAGATGSTVFGTAVPTKVDSGDGNLVELGTRVVPSVNGTVTGVRFYKSTANTGTHTGTLWSASGQVLATGTFTGESASGWQTLTFATPVPVAAGTTYVVSYRAPSGHYSADQGYFTSKGAGSAPITSPASSASAPNGLYLYGGGFPTDSYKDTNYWVDVLLSTAGASTDTSSPTTTSVTPASGATGVATTSAVTVQFSEPVSSSGLQLGLTGLSGAAVEGAVRVASDGLSATFTPTAPLRAGTNHTASVRATDLAGNQMPSAYTWTFGTAVNTDATAPTVVSTTPAGGATAVPTASTVSVVLSEPVDATRSTLTLTAASGSAVSGAVSVSTDGTTLTFTPGGALAGSTVFTASVRATDRNLNQMAVATTWTFTSAVPPDTTSPTVTALEPTANATNVPSTTLVTARFSEAVRPTGLTFTLTRSGTAVAGTVAVAADGRSATFSPSATLAGYTQYTVAVRPTDLAGNLAATTTTGTFRTALLADTTRPTVTTVAPAASATGVAVGAPVSATFSEAMSSTGLAFTVIPAGRSAVAGSVALSSDGLTATFTPAAALPASTVVAVSVTGRDRAGNTMAAARTWSFTTGTAPDTTPPTVSSRTPATDATAVATATTVSAGFSEAVVSGGLTLTLTGSDGTAVPGATVLASNGLTATFTPTAALAPTTTYTASVRATDRAGNAMTAASNWSFTTAQATCPCTVLGSAVPTVADSGDTNAVEVGSRIVPTTNAVVTGVRFYKSAANTGTHTGTLWSSSGTVLATGTFTGEAATGWQTLTFTTPVAVAANTTYVVSYLAPSGHYAADRGYFSDKGAGNAPVTAPRSTSTAGNGLFVYGGGFPTNSSGDTNYWVDAMVTTDGADNTPPTVTSRTPASAATGVAVGTSVTATFSEAVTGSSATLTIAGPSGSITAPTTLSSDGRTVTADPTTDLAAGMQYTATVGATDQVGNAMAPVSWTFTTAATASGSCPCSVFRETDTPSRTANEGQAVSLGMTFTPAVNGSVTAVRFYKTAGDTGTHTGTLFTADGAVLATGTFAAETASGWQTLTLATPVAVTAGTNYVVAYSTPQGRFGYTTGAFSSARVSGPLTAPANTATVFNGRYRYAAGSVFPVSSGNGSNYFVDVVFTPS